MMEEKRMHKRLGLDVSVQLERLDEDGVTTLRYAHVDVTDISRSGVGFSSNQKLDIGAEKLPRGSFLKRQGLAMANSNA